MTNLHTHKTIIDQFLHSLQTQHIKYIYGGVTDLLLEEKRKLHLICRDIPNIHASWVFTDISIKNVKNVESVEQYLIDQLIAIFGKKCKNVPCNERFVSLLQKCACEDNYKIYVCYQIC